MVKKYPETQESLKDFSYKETGKKKGKSFLSEPPENNVQAYQNEKYNEIDYIEDLLTDDIKKKMSESGIKFRSKVDEKEIKKKKSHSFAENKSDKTKNFVPNLSAPHHNLLKTKKDISVCVEHPEKSKLQISEDESKKEKPFSDLKIDESILLEKYITEKESSMEISHNKDSFLKENSSSNHSYKLLKNLEENKNEVLSDTNTEENRYLLKQSSMEISHEKVVNYKEPSILKQIHNLHNEGDQSFVNFSTLLKDREKKGEFEKTKLHDEELKKHFLGDKSNVNTNIYKVNKENISTGSLNDSIYKQNFEDLKIQDKQKFKYLYNKHRISCPIYKFNVISDNFKAPQKVIYEHKEQEKDEIRTESVLNYENKKRQTELYEEINAKLLEKKKQVTDENSAENQLKKFYLENLPPIALIDSSLRLNDLRHSILFGKLHIKEGNNERKTYWFELKGNFFTCFHDRETKITTFIVPNELNGDVIHPKNKDVFLSKKFQINIYESKVFIVKNKIKWAYFFRCPFFARQDFPEMIDITDKKVIRYIKKGSVFDLEITTDSGLISVKVPSLEFALENNGNYVFFQVENPDVFLKWLTAFSFKQGRQNIENR
ncbi:hypothetical protein TUBRATIS_005880 [Tubulinosema ratisbonensis]|uniref:PH domain-containing protein n=1 Tax=Tubulinosema ratisbonensis TaxID=291195 RepID=A0A437ANX5_9MICR|nr:hypothetical protein TUBRATIS_005880 [Tubulinosema ratisbonensis]